MNGDLSYYNMTGVHLISIILLSYILQKINTYDPNLPWLTSTRILSKIRFVSWVAIMMLVGAIILK